jgi:hypothetical protein
MPLKIAATWLMGKIPATTTVDGKDGRLEQAASILLDWGRTGRIQMVEFDAGLTHYFARTELEAIMLKGAIKLELSLDSAGGVINRDQLDLPRKPDAPVVVQGSSGDTIAPSPLIPMPSPVRRRA